MYETIDEKYEDLFVISLQINDWLIFVIFHEKNDTFYELNRHIYETHQKYHTLCDLTHRFCG